MPLPVLGNYRRDEDGRWLLFDGSRWLPLPERVSAQFDRLAMKTRGRVDAEA